MPLRLIRTLISAFQSQWDFGHPESTPGPRAHLDYHQVREIQRTDGWLVGGSLSGWGSQEAQVRDRLGGLLKYSYREAA